ncbi:MAG: c-type cytochrome domain-containing protein [Planctomycetota bacterium]|jgi:hypothetical protein
MGRALLFLALIAIATSAQEMGMGDVDFKRDVLPILQDRCFECHSDQKKKPKGKLRVDSKSWIMLGGKSGPVVVPGKPDRSPLYTRCALPEDHDDVMPPSGEVISKEQLGTLKSWIAAGAPFGDWTGRGGEAKPEVKRTVVDRSKQRDRLRVYRRLEEGAAAVPGAARKAAEEASARIAPVLPGGKLLRVEFARDPQAIGDKQIAALGGLRKHIAILSLGGTGVTDKAMLGIVKIPNLVRLDLQNTGVTDAGLEALGKAKPAHLRRINLYGTEVSDAGLDTLSTLPALAEVYVWETKVTEGGVRRLQQVRRGCKVVWKRELPHAEPPRQNDGNRRRR